MNYTDLNAQTIDRWVENGWEWGVPITHEQYLAARGGEWTMLLTPVKPVPKKWYPDLKGKKVLGLASGGAQQMPVFAALGAECTVLDYSEKQIESERMVARREGYSIHAVRADMTQPLPFEDASFDLIFHPVSNCYIREVMPVWRECFRVLKTGGLLMAGLDNSVNFLFDEDESHIVHTLPFDPLADESQRRALEKDDCGIQFSHGIEEQIGGQLKAGFRLLDLYEDTNGSGFLHEHSVPTFWATLAIKENASPGRGLPQTTDSPIAEYTAQLENGQIQKAYRGIMDFMGRLRTSLAGRYPDHTVSGVYPGYMDMTYFAFTPAGLKNRQLKIAVVYLHEQGRFEAWLSGANRNVQAEYIAYFTGRDTGGFRLSRVSPGVDSILECVLAEQPDFDSPGQLAALLEEKTLAFIRGVESLLEQSDNK